MEQIKVGDLVFVICACSFLAGLFCFITYDILRNEVLSEINYLLRTIKDLKEKIFELENRGE